ncbi:AbrB family transcriptional regulator [Bacillus sp. DNRA2]|uniref:AbrB family transcriptional regulator n=1 Tax=Bacillus sp. DNRA2 TaxID=2723053 RepID=UPI00145CFD4F|nr:AbrB family transcriptional regulator [Bacillus sp. DNRA2]NMD71150.1 AbrB family transcriptional regulator [Bacillus sp. DNRA2]
MGIFSLNLKSKPVQFLFTFLIALFGGIVFSLLHIPVPWLLGPMAFILIFTKLFRVSFYWPSKIRDTGLLIIGYSIGLSFTKEVLKEISLQLPVMFLFTTLTLLLCFLLAFIVAKLSGVNFPTVLTGSIPGGLTQMVYFAEETKGIDVSIVTFLQVVRLFVIIFTVPLLVFSPFFPGETSNIVKLGSESGASQLINSLPEVLVYCTAIILFAILGKKANAPTPYLLGPIVATICLNLTGLHGPELPVSFIDMSQLMISVYIGMLLQVDKLKQHRNILWLSLISGIILVTASFVFSYLLHLIYKISVVTAFLSLAPGGMDQMGIIAHEVKADLSFVAGFQMFRLLFIYFAVPPFLRWLFQRTTHSNKKTPNASN